MTFAAGATFSRCNAMRAMRITAGYCALYHQGRRNPMPDYPIITDSSGRGYGTIYAAVIAIDGLRDEIKALTERAEKAEAKLKIEHDKHIDVVGRMAKYQLEYPHDALEKMMANATGG
jgi:hypothetical protein